MATQRLPSPGADAGNWGTILNNYLRVSLGVDGGVNVWTTSTRPTSPDTNTTGINSTTNVVERWNGTSWVTVLTAGSGNSVNDFIFNNVFKDTATSGNVSLTARATAQHYYFGFTATANRVFTLKDTGAKQGDFFIIRTFGLDKSTFSVKVTADSGPLLTLPLEINSGTEYPFEFNGTYWYYAYDAI